MTLIIRNIHQDTLLVANALANNKINKYTLEATKRLKEVIDHLLSASLRHKRIKKLCRIKMLCNAVDLCIQAALSLNCGFYRASKPLAVISGAGIAGLAASFELRLRGFNVVIAEKRRDFSRLNIINLGIEVQVFLKKFNLLEKFEKFVASRIQEHRYVIIEKNKSATRLGISDVSGLQLDDSVTFESKNFNKLFDKDGIYSVPIRELQTFLAGNALEAGVNILGNVTVDILSCTSSKGVSKVRITAERTLQPDLFFIAEGAHSTTACQLGMKMKEVKNACTGENWIFGNIPYSGSETFVVSLIDASEKTLRIANVIFNAKSGLINVAVTSSKGANKDSIRKQLVQTVCQVFDQKAFPLKGMPPLEKMHSLVSTPIEVSNRIAEEFSRGNIFRLGDSAGSTSPLGGAGGTIALVAVSFAVGRLVDNYKKQSRQINENFNEISESYTSRWIAKSNKVKEFCVGLFDKQGAI